jgi:hypothetical protein
LVLLIALLGVVGLRLLCPPGLMPNIDGRPGSPLVICTGDGVRTVERPSHRAPGSPDGKVQHDQCAFSGIAFAAPANAPDIARPVEAPEIAPVAAGVGRVVNGPDRRRAQAPRAPPLAL